MAETAFRGNAATLNAVMSPYYLGLGGHDIQTWNDDHNTVEEDITAAYAHWAWKGELGGRKSHLDVGLRYEKTDVKRQDAVVDTVDLVWTADNDFALVYPRKQAAVFRQVQLQQHDAEHRLLGRSAG